MEANLERSARAAWFLLVGLGLAAPPGALWGQSAAAGGVAPIAAARPVRTNVSILRVERAPRLEDFLEMKPHPDLEGKLTRIEQFTQQDPKNGQPATQRTEAYLGYDDKNLYVIFVAFDSHPAQIRARLTRRENIYDDDLVQVLLDTFHDERRAYAFVANPLGVQLDRLWTEGSGNDDSFDTVWQSKGKLTASGYVVWMAIPFRSLRFSPTNCTWGILLQRIIPRLNEVDFWPWVSAGVQGRLNQEGTVSGFQKISPGRNIQLIPYGVFRSFRALDSRDALNPAYVKERADFDGGLDAKFVLKDRLVLDTTVNPDFSQVESDEPQVTVNQRFEVFFPEKRPFFIENASFFETPISLLFTRRIADPQFGVRLTGKVGRYAIGLLFADDQSPGRSVPANDPLSGKRAFFGIARVNRDLGKHSTIGAIYTSRQLGNAFNRAGGVDIRFKFGKNVVGNVQAVTTATRFTDGTRQAGPAYEVFAEWAGRKLIFNTLYQDTSKGYLTQTGFFRRPDIRQFSNFARYRFRPEGKRLISHGPAAFQSALWNHARTRVEKFIIVDYQFEFKRQTEIGAFINTGRERLLRSEFAELPVEGRDFPTGHRGIFWSSSFFPQLTLFGNTAWGTTINFLAASGPPISARSHYFDGGVTVRPMTRLTIENRYLLTRLRVRGREESIFTNHIIRSKWNYQISRELSVRFITQYAATLSNPSQSGLARNKNLNFDFLVTYLLHPGTAIYVGYNSNLQNPDPLLALTSGNGQAPNRFVNDGKQFFVKASYLLRF